MEKAISSYWFRSLILRYVKKMESADETAFWMDQIEVVPECRFDTEADTWRGKRHWENILWLRENKYNGFEKWNRNRCMEQLDLIKKERELLHKKFDYIGQMIGW